MLSSRFACSLCFSFFSVLILHRTAFAQSNFTFYYCLYDQGNYTANSTYKANLDHLLSTLTTDHQIDYGFYNFSYGQDSKANAIGLCRGDVMPDACRRCLNDSITLLTKLCPNQTEAIGWYDECMLRYSDRSFFSLMDPTPGFYSRNQNNASDQDRFTQVARNLLEELTGEAASGDSRLKFATGKTAAPNLPKIYGLVQCTPDLSYQDCNDCLLGALAQIQQCCGGKAGGGFGRPSCGFRYESYSFFESKPVSTPPSQPPPSPLLSNRTTETEGNKTIIIIVVPVVVVVIAAALLIISICIFLRTRKPRSKAAKSLSEDEITNVESLQFDFNTIKIATNGFSDANKLGEGGFGAVFKGRLPSGQDIAVKRLSQISSQGDDEFKNEILLVAKLQHRNLVQLLGFCLEKNERLLVYEFVQNSSLEKFLFDPLKRMDLDWKSRYKIVEDIVRGLIYLHEDSQHRIIHRDLKASNILLDAEMNAKISDFGTAKLCAPDQTQGDTSRIIGTYGYMAPEYAFHGYFSIKSDVFSLGILILEIVSGQKNNRAHGKESVEDLINYAWRNWQEGTALNIVDPSLISGSRTEMAKCIHVGLLCVQENLAERPTMGTILLMLSSYSFTLPRPSRPAFCMNSSTHSNMPWQWKDDGSQMTKMIQSDKSKDDSIQESSDDMSITELHPR